MYHGIINVYKEAGFTSHDVVAKLRKLIASGQQAAPAKAEEATELPQALAELFKLLKRSPELLEKLEAA